MQSSAIFPVFYLPPVNYISDLKRFGADFLLEGWEHFVKQTYRNRAKIYSPNGPLDLIVPVVKGSKVHTKMKDVRISYDLRWQKLHWKSLESCYRSSAYFEFYEAELVGFYEKRYDFLLDLDLELTAWLLKQLKLELPLRQTTAYTTDAVHDFRAVYNAKQAVSDTGFKRYFQVFDDRQGFLPNLSIVDLLFNQGPQAKQYL